MVSRPWWRLPMLPEATVILGASAVDPQDISPVSYSWKQDRRTASLPTVVVCRYYRTATLAGAAIHDSQTICAFKVPIWTIEHHIARKEPVCGYMFVNCANWWTTQ